MSLDRYDSIADLFDQVSETPLHRRFRAAAVAALRPLAGRRVLDLGTGPGGLASDLAAEGASVVGIDGSPEMLRRAACRAAGPERRAIRLVRADAGRLPLASRSVDDVGGILVLHLLDDARRALAECRRVLRAGGRLAFVTQSDDFEMPRLEEDGGEIARDGSEWVGQPIDALERAFVEGCWRSASSHLRRDRGAWVREFREAGLPEPTITVAIPGVAWLLFAQLP